MRLRSNRRYSAFVLAALFGLGIATAQAGEGVKPATPGDATYVLSNVSLGEITGGLGIGDSGAVVHFEMHWSGNEWPGYALCRAEVVDAAGAVVGALDFETTSILRNPPKGLIEVPLFGTGGTPVSATAFCDEAHRPADSAGYVLSNPSVSGTTEDPRLTFDVKWANSEPPMYQACEAILERVDGTVDAYQFGLSTGPGIGTVLLTPEFADAEVLSLSCSAFTGQDGWGQ